MASNISGLTGSQCKQVDVFLNLFADVEAALKKRLGGRANDRTGVQALIEASVAKNPYWTDSANRLRHLADIRNVLTHQRGTIFGYPIAVAPASIEALRSIKEQLLKPEPASQRYRRSVKMVSAGDSIASVLRLAFENGYSQFPVLSDGQFGGLITENEIIRWLGRQSKANSVLINLEVVTVRMVLKEKDPSLRGIAIFHFEKLDAPLEEVMGRFSSEPALEVILLTETGSKQTPIKGIVTQWDAARYPS